MNLQPRSQGLFPAQAREKALGTRLDELNPSMLLLSGQDGDLINCCFLQASGALYAM